MVARFASWFLLSVGLILQSTLLAADVPQYRVGDVATTDVVTPIPLVVTDPVATALLKEKEEREIRFIVRFCPTLADKAERAFRSQMALLREEFIQELTVAYGKNKVDKSVGRTPKFLELTSRFRDEHKGTPKLFLYMPYWAQGRSDEHLLTDWIGHIRRAMDRPIRPDKLPGGDIGTTVRMITVPDFQVKVQLEHAERYGVLTPLDNIAPLTQVRRGMGSEFPEGDAYVADFLQPFVQPNCVFDEELTRLARERRVDSLIVAANYAAGETLVRAGQVVDAKTVAALDQLRQQLPEPAAVDNASGTGGASRDTGVNVWVIGGIGGGALALVGFLLVLWRRSARVTAVRVGPPERRYDSGLAFASSEMKAVGGSPAEPVARLEGESEREWRERALAAEHRAEKAKELARRNVTDALKDKVVQHLSTQRDELIDRQLSAAEQMAGMEARLQDIQGPLSERLKIYETRIAQLEEQLAVKDQENRALIQAKIQNIREQIQQAKVGRNFDWN